MERRGDLSDTSGSLSTLKIYLLLNLSSAYCLLTIILKKKYINKTGERNKLPERPVHSPAHGLLPHMPGVRTEALDREDQAPDAESSRRHDGRLSESLYPASYQALLLRR